MRKAAVNPKLGASAMGLLPALALVLVVGWPVAALSADGVLEINQASVLASGGFPITLNAAGSYKLTSNLSPSSNADAIVVTADDVHIDLNGFAILGGNDCVGSPPPQGSGSGVASAARGTTVENGTVRGFRGYGISLASEGRVEDIRVRCAGNGGIRVGAEGRIERSAVSLSGVGVETGSAALLVDNEISSSTSYGMILGADSSIRGNVLLDNNGGNQNAQLQATQISIELGPNRCGASLTCTSGGICGNGFVEAAEACDDGGSSAGDGCSPTCSIEAGYGCVGQPSVCTPASVCGDSIVSGLESCDGADLDGQSCQTLGFSGGDLSCSATCSLDSSGCF